MKNNNILMLLLAVIILMGIIIGMSLNNGGNHDSVMNESNDTTINITLNNSENSTNDTI